MTIGAGAVDDRAAGIVDVVGGNQRPLFEAENTGERSGRSAPEQRVDLGFRHGPRHLEHAICEARIQHGRTHRVPVQLTLEFGIDERDRRGAARRGRR